MIEVMLVEDDEIIRGLLKKMVERVEGFAVTAQASSPDEAVVLFEKSPSGVVFVDIDLNGESGLYCARRLCDISSDVKIVFATAHSEYMADAFEIYAFDYIVKPFNLERIRRTLEKIKDMDMRLKSSAGANAGNEGGIEKVTAAMPENAAGNTAKTVPRLQNKLAVRGKDEIVFIDIGDIIFAERLNGSTRLVTAKDVYHMNISLTELLDKLPTSEFIRSHRSYIIRVSAIAKLTQYGRWTYTVSFAGTTETALMTYDNYEMLKESSL